MKLFENGVLEGTPAYQETIQEARLSLQIPSSLIATPKILSGELSGSISVVEEPNNGWYLFECIFEGPVTNGWVRIGNHLVCHDGSAYGYQQQQPDNTPSTYKLLSTNHLNQKQRRTITTTISGNDPIPLQSNLPYAIHASLAHNGTFDHTNGDDIPRLAIRLTRYNHTSSSSRQTNSENETNMYDAQHYQEFRPMMTPSNQKPLIGGYEKRRYQTSPKLVFRPQVPELDQKREDLQRSVSQGWGQWLNPNILALVKLPEGLVVELDICHESDDDSFHDSNNADKSNENHHHHQQQQECLGHVMPESNGRVRVDTHATDRSYASFNVTFAPKNRNSKISLTVQTSVWGPFKDELSVFVTVNEMMGDGKFSLKVQPRYTWFRTGKISKTSATSLVASTPGFEKNVTVTLTHENNTQNKATSIAFEKEQDNNVGLTLELDHSGEKVGLFAGSTTALWESSSNKNAEGDNSSSNNCRDGNCRNPKYSSSAKTTFLEQLEGTMRERKMYAQRKLEKSFGENAKVAEAIEAALMWSWIYNPIEGGPFLPVSRSWGNNVASQTQSANPDWNYVLFDWDNIFVSYMAGLFDKDIAYSNLFVLLRGKTPDGFIPNVKSAGGIRRSNDRSQPPIGAKVLLELYKKYQDDWIVKALWEDLAEWNDWFIAKRLLEPLGLIGLGSFEEHAKGISDHADNLQAARWESGLDNSPMYDESPNLYDKETHMMQMYDVGMTALVANEAFCLAELAQMVGMDAERAFVLKARGERLRANILRHLWDPDRKVFANRYRGVLPGTNTSFVRAITPTSFYPLMLPAAQEGESFFLGETEISKEAFRANMDSMVGSWLLNTTRFCLGNFAGNDANKCYWGLPSVSADDPTFMAPGANNYWRGFVWGPMSQLVFWSLQESNLEEPSPRYNSAIDRNSIAFSRLLRRQQETTRTAKPVASNFTTARKALCSQMKELMMSQWNKNRHICENYSPFKDANDCTGTEFYHWGALNGLIGMIEDGTYDQTDFSSYKIE